MAGTATHDALPRLRRLSVSSTINPPADINAFARYSKKLRYADTSKRKRETECCHIAARAVSGPRKGEAPPCRQILPRSAFIESYQCCGGRKCQLLRPSLYPERAGVRRSFERPGLRAVAARQRPGFSETRDSSTARCETLPIPKTSRARRQIPFVQRVDRRPARQSVWLRRKRNRRCSGRSDVVA